jgi:hypothetical protein
MSGLRRHSQTILAEKDDSVELCKTRDRQAAHERQAHRGNHEHQRHGTAHQIAALEITFVDQELTYKAIERRQTADRRRA